MIWTSTFAFALALVAVVCAGVVLIISLRLTRAQESLQSTVAASLSKRLRTLDQASADASKALRELERATPTKLAAEVGELSEAVARLAETQRKFAGKFYQATRQGPEQARADALGGALHDDDDELGAMLALQRSPPGKPL